MKAVLIFKQLKHDLYNWSQVLSLLNKLLLMFSIFFSLSAVFNFIIQVTPSIAGVSALSLTKADLSVKYVNAPSIIFGIYCLGILNALMAGAIAILGIVVRSKLDLDLARINVCILTIAPVFMGGLFVATGCLNYLYMEKAFEKKKENDPDNFVQESYEMSKFILIALTTFGAILQFFAVFAARRISV